MSDDFVAEAREYLDQLDEDRAAQPERLQAARDELARARQRQEVLRPLGDDVTAINSVDGTASLTLPTIASKELFGARMAFELLGGEDPDDVVTRYFGDYCQGDPGVAMLVFSAALTTIAGEMMPVFLEDLERHGDWTTRVHLIQAAAQLWADPPDLG